MHGKFKLCFLELSRIKKKKKPKTFLSTMVEFLESSEPMDTEGWLYLFYLTLKTTLKIDVLI